MKKIELVKNEVGGIDFKCGDTVIPTENCIESYSFWEDIERSANRAMFRIKKDNPKIGFEFNLTSMMVPAETRREALVSHVNRKHPDIDAKLLFDIIDAEAEKIKPSIPEGDVEGHPNPFMKVQMDSDLVKAVIASVISNYEKQKKA